MKKHNYRALLWKIRKCKNCKESTKRVHSLATHINSITGFHTKVYFVCDNKNCERYNAIRELFPGDFAEKDKSVSQINRLNGLNIENLRKRMLKNHVLLAVAAEWLSISSSQLSKYLLEKEIFPAYLFVKLQMHLDKLEEK